MISAIGNIPVSARNGGPPFVEIVGSLSTIKNKIAMQARLTQKAMRDSRQYFHRYIRFPLSHHFKKNLRQVHRRDVKHSRALAVKLGNESVRIGADNIFGGARTAPIADPGSEYLGTRFEWQAFADDSYAAEVRAQIV